MVNSISAEIISNRATAKGASATTAFLVFDTESVPDGRLLAKVKYAGENLTPEAAVEKARQEVREKTKDASDFIPVTYQIPVAVCVLRVGADFLPQALACLDAPHFRTPEIVRQFWRGVSVYQRAKLVTFNGRGFDLPLMELAAFDHGCSARQYFASRNRYNGNQIDLFDWMTNYGAYRMDGGLNLLAKRGNRPVAVGKMDVAGDQVYAMYQQGRCQEINDYCMFDTLDTYFIFLPNARVVGRNERGARRAVGAASAAWLAEKIVVLPALRRYLEAGEQGRPPRKSLLIRVESRRRDRNHVRSLYCVRSPRGASNAIDLPPGAAAGGIVRLLTYNIHKGVGADRRYRLERVIAVIKAEAADLICLQEVDRNVRRSRRDNQPALLADKLDAAVHVYQLNVPRGEGGYGNLLLSRWPFREVRQIALNYKQRPPRGAQLVVVDTPAGPLHLVHIHLGLSSRERRWQAAHLLQHPLFQAAAHLPTLIAGDANDCAQFAKQTGLRAARFSTGHGADAALPHLPRISTAGVHR